MDFLPIFMDVKDRLCLVIGGGEVAQRKALVLLDAGAKVKAVAPEFLTEFTGLAIECVVQRFQPAHLNGVILVIAATDVRAK